MLQKVNTFTLPGTNAFEATKEIFGNHSEANVGSFGSDFEDQFLGQVENGIPEAVFTVFRLGCKLTDKQIHTSLRKEYGEVALWHLFSFLKEQNRGQEGQLTTEYANIFYIRNRKRKLRAVGVFWDCASNSWQFVVCSTNDGGKWEDGSKIFSLLLVNA